MKRKRNNKQKNDNKVVLTRQIVNVNRSSATIDVISTIPLYFYTVTSNVSTSGGADQRSYAFPTILSGTFPFVDMALVYSDYKINYASIVMTPYSNVSIVLPPIHVTCDPDGAGANPTNSTVIASPNAVDFSISQLGSKSAKFLFPGVDQNTKIWKDTATASTGAFYFGLNTTGLTPTTTLIFEASFVLNVSFRNIKGN